MTVNLLDLDGESLTVSAVNRQLVYAANEDELLQAICQAIVEQRGVDVRRGIAALEFAMVVPVLIRSPVSTCDF